MIVRTALVIGFSLVALHAHAQTQDGFGKSWSPVQVDKSKKKGIQAVEEAKQKAEKACKAKFEYTIDWEKFKISTFKKNRFEPWHIGMRCGDVFDALRGLCSRSLESRKNVAKYFNRLVCTVHPHYADIMKWRKDNQVDQDERSLLLKESKEKFNQWMMSNCVTGPRLSPTKHVLCDLKDKLFTLNYSVWSVNIGSEVHGFLQKYFAE